MRYAHYLVYENDNGLNGLYIVYIATGMPDIKPLIFIKIHILRILECTFFCAVMHIFVCIMGRGEKGKIQVSGIRDQRAEVRNQKVGDGGSES